MKKIYIKPEAEKICFQVEEELLATELTPSMGTYQMPDDWPSLT